MNDRSKKMDIFQMIRRNEKDKFYSLIDSIDINIQKRNGENLLHEAIAYNNTSFGLELIRKAINLNCQDKAGMTPLHYVSVHDNYELAKTILDNGGDLSITDEHDNSPLWNAVFNARGDYKFVKLFMEHGADSYHKNRHGKSPLDFAIQINDKNLIRLLSD